MEVYQILLISIIGGLTFLFIAFSFIYGQAFFMVSFSRRKDDEHFAQNENPEDKKTPNRIWYFSNKLEEIEMKSFDNLKLKAYFLNNNSHKLAILIHGYRGRYYSLVSQARIFFENGYDVLCINNRAHDTSEGKYFSMGPKETKDTLGWINLMIKRNPNYEIALFGVSMGGHIAMMSASQTNLPVNVKCIIEDCGYASLKNMLYEATKANHLIFPRYAVWLGNLYAKVFHHFSFNDSTENAFKNLKLPILLIHGEDDTYVPYANLAKNASYVPEGIYKEVVTFKGTNHNKSILQYEKYQKTVNDFVNKFIK